MTNQEAYGKITLEALRSKDWVSRIPQFENMEKDGFSEASLALGQLYSGVDDRMALLHFTKGATLGCAECAWGAAALIGHEYLPDINDGDAEWFRYCLQAAKGACCDAMNELGNVCHRRGDYLGMFYWYEKAALYEHPEGSNSVDCSLAEWKKAGGPELESCVLGLDESKTAQAKIAFEVFTAKRKITPDLVNGLMPAILTGNDDFLPLVLGDLFEQLQIDDGMAKTYYQVAGHNNSPIGMRRIGNMLAYGKGCEQSMEKAFSWFPGAAEAGERVAQFVMGQFTKKQNPLLAAYWFMASQRRGYEPALQALMEMCEVMV